MILGIVDSDPPRPYAVPGVFPLRERGEQAWPRFPTDPWFQEFIAAINASDRYREVAADWEGDVAFQHRGGARPGCPETVWGLLDLWHGACRGGGVVDEARPRRVLLDPRPVLALEGRRSRATSTRSEG